MGEKRSEGNQNEHRSVTSPPDDARSRGQNDEENNRSRSKPAQGQKAPSTTKWKMNSDKSKRPTAPLSPPPISPISPVNGESPKFPETQDSQVESSKEKQSVNPSDAGEDPEDSGSDASRDVEMIDAPNGNTIREEERKSLKPQAFHQKIYKREDVAKKLRKWYLAQPGPEAEKLEKQLFRVNLQLESLNKEKAFDLNHGTIPLKNIYIPHKNLSEPCLEKLKEDKQDLEAQKQWNKIKHEVTQYNHEKGYDKTWDFPRDYLQKRIGVADSHVDDNPDTSPQAKVKKTHKPSDGKQRSTGKHESAGKQQSGGKQRSRPIEESESEDDSDVDDGSSKSSDSGSNESIDNESSESSDDESYTDSSDVETDIDDTPEGLQKALEKHYPGMLLLGKVLAFKKCGSGHQCLVGYGNEKCKTFRLVPGSSVGNWSPKDTPELGTGQRGHLKDGEKWKYTGADVDRFIHVAWRPYPEDGDDSLASLHPRRCVTCPATFVRVIWRDKAETWETRGAIRRLLGNHQQKADFAIYIRAKAQEKKHHKDQEPLPVETSSETKNRSSVPAENYRRAGSAMRKTPRAGSSRHVTPRHASAEPRSGSMALYDYPDRVIKRTPRRSPITWRAPELKSKSNLIRMSPHLHFDQQREDAWYEEELGPNITERDAALVRYIMRQRNGDIRSGRSGMAGRSGRTAALV